MAKSYVHVSKSFCHLDSSYQEVNLHVSHSMGIRFWGRGERGGDTPLYGLYRYVKCQRVWFLSCFGQKEGINFNHSGLKV